MKPRLRTLDIQPTPEGYLLRDPYGVSQEVLVLSPEAMYLASLMDGTRTLEDIQAEILKSSGSVIPREKLEELQNALEKAGFLETEEILGKIAEAERTFLSKPRPMALAQASYPGTREGLEAFLNGMLAFAPEVEERPLQALLMPHLELRRVPEAYGAAYRAMQKTPAPERVLILGVAHRPIRGPAAALPLSIETPHGVLEADLEALQALDALVGFELFREPLAFKEEHSIEFPAIFVKAAWPSAKVLPLIVASEDEAALKELAEALRLLAKERPFFPLLAVDLSHVGGRFGHGPIGPELKNKAERTDRSYLDLLAQGRFEEAFQFLSDRENDTYIDALGAAQAASRVIVGEGRVLAYRLSPELETLSAVGAGAVGWY